jgi:DNA-binding MarR family transcriptional regulator
MPQTSKAKKTTTPVSPPSRKQDPAKRDITPRETFDVGSLGFLISSTARMMIRTLGAALREHGVAPGQWSVLRHLWAEEGLSQRELSALVGIEEATLTRTIDRLVRDKLAIRRRNPTNGRQHAIYLSTRGRQLRDVLVPLVQQVNRRAARHVPPSAIPGLIDNLVLIRAAADEDVKAATSRATAARERERQA